MLTRAEAIKEIFEAHGKDAIFVTSTGYISRAVYELYSGRKNIFYMQGSMGLAPAIGLGIALNTNRLVVVISGDGALLMHLGITHTIRDSGCTNLFVYVLDNGCYESVGGQACARLEDGYVGVHRIIQISSDGKPPRVGVSCEQNRIDVERAIAATRPAD
jgi:phosphonopyruvate decarboxylase